MRSSPKDFITKRKRRPSNAILRLIKRLSNSTPACWRKREETNGTRRKIMIIETNRIKKNGPL
jgi:hypothetical protein